MDHIYSQYNILFGFLILNNNIDDNKLYISRFISYAFL